MAALVTQRHVVRIARLLESLSLGFRKNSNRKKALELMGLTLKKRQIFNFSFFTTFASSYISVWGEHFLDSMSAGPSQLENPKVAPNGSWTAKLSLSLDLQAMDSRKAACPLTIFIPCRPASEVARASCNRQNHDIHRLDTCTHLHIIDQNQSKLP